METEKKPQEAKQKLNIAEKQAPKQAQPKTTTPGKLAAVLIRNVTQADGKITDTLTMLRLRKKFACVVVDNTPVMKGMLTKVKDYITYGEIDTETLKTLEEKRGTKNKEGSLKKHFHLHPPKGGFERKGIKHSFTQGGALGNRGDKINKLLNKMI